MRLHGGVANMSSLRIAAWLLGTASSALSLQSGSAGEQDAAGHPPYFNFKMRQFLIEGSHSIVPSPPVEVGHERQLLLDARVVDDAWGCRRTVHAPEKHAANPLLPGPAPGVAPADQGTVIYDEEAGRFRLWTLLWDQRRARYDLDYAIAYYESEDGIRWRAPELGLVERDGSRANNIVMAARGEVYTGPSIVRVPPRL